MAKKTSNEEVPTNGTDGGTTGATPEERPARKPRVTFDQLVNETRFLDFLPEAAQDWAGAQTITIETLLTKINTIQGEIGELQERKRSALGVLKSTMRPLLNNAKELFGKEVVDVAQAAAALDGKE